MKDSRGVYLRRPAELLLEDGELVVRCLLSEHRERYALAALFMLWIKHPRVLIPLDVRDALLEQGVFMFRQYDGQLPFEVLFPRLRDDRSRMVLSQTRATLPMRKNLRAQVVTAMLKNQREVLRTLGLLTPESERWYNERVKQGLLLSPEGCHEHYLGLFDMGLVRDVQQPEVYFELGREVLRVMMKERLFHCGLEPSLGWYGEVGAQPERLYETLCYPFYPIMDWLVYQSFRYRSFLVLDTDRFAEVLLEVLPCSFPVVRNRYFTNGVGSGGLVPEEVTLQEAVQRLTERVCGCYGGDLRVLEFAEVVF